MEQTIASLTREDATWKKRYLLPTFTCGKIAQNQRSRGIFSSDFAGVMQVYSWDRDSGNIEVKTDSPSGQREAWISADGQWVVFHKDSEGVGSELGHFAAVPFVGSSDEVVDVIDVTPGLSPYGAVGFATGSGRVAMSIAVDGGQTILVKDGGVVGATTRTFRRIDTLVQTRAMELSTCGRFLAQESNEHTVGVAAVSEEEGNGSSSSPAIAMDFALNVYDMEQPDGSPPVAQLWDGASTSISCTLFSPVADPPLIAAATSSSGSLRPLLWEPLAGKRRDTFGPFPELQGQLVPVCFSTDGARLCLQQLHQAQTRLHVVDVTSGKLCSSLPSQPKGVFRKRRGQLAIGTCFFDAEEIVVNFMNEAMPDSIIALDATSGAHIASFMKFVCQKQTTLTRVHRESTNCQKKPSDATASAREGEAKVEEEQERRFHSVTFPSAGGEGKVENVQGFLMFPAPLSEGPFPTVLHMHGGPSNIQLQTYNPAALAWMDAGFAFMTINYHGSTFFGTEWQRSIDGRLGTLEVQDMAGAHAFLVKRGISCENIFLQGRSYGGFLCLLGLGMAPELWAGAMASSAIADWFLMYEDQADRLRGYQRALFRGTPDETAEATAKASPISYVDNVTAPLLVIQGENDTQCPPRQMRAYEEKMKAAGKNIDVQWYATGHSSGVQAVQIDHQERAMVFALTQLMKNREGGEGQVGKEKTR